MAINEMIQIATAMKFNETSGSMLLVYTIKDTMGL